MKLRAVSGIMLTLLLTGMLTLAFDIQPVEASGTIYIRADGSVDPPTAPISTLDNITYTFTGNIVSTGIYDSIIVERNNITIEGDGYMLQGPSYLESRAAIRLSGRTNVTVRNTQIRNFYYGIALDSSSNNSISENNITNNYLGIWLGSSSSNSISGNTITKNRVFGIQLRSSSSNSISGNSIAANNYVGIRLGEASSNNIIYHNNFVNNLFQVYTENSVNVWNARVRAYSNSWDDGYPSGGNYWSDYKDRYPDAVEIDQSGIWNTQYVIGLHNVDNYPLTSPQSDTAPPTLSILSPENKTYAANDVPLNSTLSEPTSWIGYSLDGQANVTVGGNTTLSGLSDGSHTLTVYAKDMAGNAGTSERVCFSIDTQQAGPFPAWIVVAIVATTGVGAALLAYFAKVKKTTRARMRARMVLTKYFLHGSRYFLHGFAFSLLFLILALIWILFFGTSTMFFFSVLRFLSERGLKSPWLIVFALAIGATIGVGGLAFLAGGLNRFLAKVVWGIETNTSLWSLPVHGIDLLIFMSIADIAFVLAPNLAFPRISTAIVTFIIGALIDGYIGKSVAFWFPD
jgi:parallel beta-helix repeat protein